MGTEPNSTIRYQTEKPNAEQAEEIDELKARIASLENEKIKSGATTSEEIICFVIGFLGSALCVMLGYEILYLLLFGQMVVPGIIAIIIFLLASVICGIYSVVEDPFSLLDTGRFFYLILAGFVVALIGVAVNLYFDKELAQIFYDAAKEGGLRQWFFGIFYQPSA